MTWAMVGKKRVIVWEEKRKLIVWGRIRAEKSFVCFVLLLGGFFWFGFVFEEKNFVFFLGYSLEE